MTRNRDLLIFTGIVSITGMTLTAMLKFGTDSALLGTGCAAVGALLGFNIKDHI